MAGEEQQREDGQSDDARRGRRDRTRGGGGKERGRHEHRRRRAERGQREPPRIHRPQARQRGHAEDHAPESEIAADLAAAGGVRSREPRA